MRYWLLIILFLGFIPLFSQADFDFGAKTTAQEAGIAQAPASINEIAGNFLQPILSFVGVLFFILMLYAGVLWMTAAGDDKKIEKAKEIIIAAVIGLLIVVAAYAITKFVGESINNPSTTI